MTPESMGIKHKYLISKAWIEKWKSYIEDVSNSLPGPIDNSDLIASPKISTHVSPISTKNMETEKMVSKAVNCSQWDMLKLIYGGGPCLI